MLIKFFIKQLKVGLQYNQVIPAMKVFLGLANGPIVVRFDAWVEFAAKPDNIPLWGPIMVTSGHAII